MRLRILALLFTAAVITACVQPQPTSLRGPNPYAFTRSLPVETPVRTRVEINDSEFERYATFVGIINNISNTRDGLDTPDITWLRSTIDKQTGAITHQIRYMDLYEDDWRFYNRASDERATSLEFVNIDEDVIQCGSSRVCSRYEIMGAVLSDEYLRLNSDGFRVQFAGRRGDRSIAHVTSRMISMQLDAIEGWRSEQ